MLRFLCALVCLSSLSSGQARGKVVSLPDPGDLEVFSGPVRFTASGLSLSVSGDTLVLGGTELVSVYRRTTPTSWVLEADLDPASTEVLTCFGASVAIDGDTLAVGAPLEDGAGGETGVVHVFERDSGATTPWVRTARIEAPAGVQGDAFGSAVAIVSDTLFVGAPGNDTRGPDGGAVFVHRRDQGGTNAWGTTQTLLPPDGTEARSFGRVLACENDTLVVSGFRRAPALEGRLTTYVASGPIWSVQSLLAAPTQSPAFGHAIALQADTLVVGEPESVDGAQSGCVRVFERTDSSAPWIERHDLRAPDGKAGDGFGFSVAIRAGTIAAGAPQWTDDPASQSTLGAAYVFSYRSKTWRLDHVFRGTLVGFEGGWYGFATALQGSVLFVGAPNQRGANNFLQSSGNVYARELGTVARGPR